MPVHPINRGGEPRGNSVRISRGSVVEYEQHGKLLLAVVVDERKSKWGLINEKGEDAQLAAERLFLLTGSTVPEHLPRDQKVQALKFLSHQADSLSEQIDNQALWEQLKGELREYTLQELIPYFFDDPAPVETLGLRRALIRERVFLKRGAKGFEPRAPEAVSEALEQAALDKKIAEANRQLYSVLKDRLQGRFDNEVPRRVIILEEVAALGTSAPDTKDALAIISDLEEELKLSFDGKAEDKAFRLLERIKHFSADQDLNLIRVERPSTFNDELLTEAEALSAQLTARLKSANRPKVDPITVTIDGAETRDMDDALSIVRTEFGFEVGIHISDVAFLIERQTVLDEAALYRASTVYAPDYRLTMLPEILSEGALSLVAGSPRASMSFFATVDLQGNTTSRRIELTELSVTRNCTYEEVDKVLYGDGSISPEIDQTLNDLWKVVGLLESRRVASGAVQFNRRELFTTIKDGRINLEESGEDLPARKLVSELMIFANETAALYGKEHRLHLLYRGQEAPEVNIAEASLAYPEGPAREYAMRGMMKRSTVGLEPNTHFGLGVAAYIQGTSPIRRYGDLINQRQIAAALSGGASSYSFEELNALSEQLEVRLEEANYLQRGRQRYFLQRYLLQESLNEVWGTIVRSDGAKPLVELETTLSIHPFYMADRSKLTRSRVGERIALSIEKNFPRSEILVLREILR